MGPRPRVTALLGPSGSGKSHAARALIERDRRVIIVQPYFKNAYGAMPFASYESLKETLRAANPKSFRVSVPVFDVKDFVKICRLAWAVAPVTLVLDETATYLENAAGIPREFRLIVQVGRHAGHDENQEVALVVIGQRPINLPPVLRNEVRLMYIFNLGLDTDAEIMRKEWRLSPETIADVGRLGQYERIRVVKREDNTLDISKGRGI